MAADIFGKLLDGNVAALRLLAQRHEDDVIEIAAEALAQANRGGIIRTRRRAEDSCVTYFGGLAAVRCWSALLWLLAGGSDALRDGAGFLRLLIANGLRDFQRISAIELVSGWPVRSS